MQPRSFSFNHNSPLESTHVEAGHSEPVSHVEIHIWDDCQFSARINVARAGGQHKWGAIVFVLRIQETKCDTTLFIKCLGQSPCTGKQSITVHMHFSFMRFTCDTLNGYATRHITLDGTRVGLDSTTDYVD
jgi:hypothetical protein